MIKKILLLVLTLSTTMVFISCGDNNPEIPVTPEVITTLNYTLTPTGGGTAITLSFVDLDGDGGNAPVITGGTLNANTTYTGTLELLNESLSPIEDITLEIEEEDEDHQFFFQSNIVGLAINYADQDADGNPVGLTSTLTTGTAASGNITVTLVHEPMKSAAGVSDGDITNAEGEIDIEVSFPVNVE